MAVFSFTIILSFTLVASFSELDDSATTKFVAQHPAWPMNDTAITVACVGDSITAGYLSSHGLNYPNQLQTLLGSGFKVMNFGVGGRTMLKKGDAPYWNTGAYTSALKSNATILVLMLGTNDAKFGNWDKLSAEFPVDYAAMVKSFQAMSSKPNIYLMVPPPLYQDSRYGMNQTVINTLFPSASGAASVRQLATDLKLVAPIDLYTLFQGHCPVVGGTPGHPENKTDVPCDWIAGGGRDACHPNNDGYGMVAAAVKAAIAPQIVNSGDDLSDQLILRTTLV